MPGPEGAPEKLVVLGGPQVIEVVEPIAVELGLDPAVHETVRGSIGEIGLTGEGVAAAFIDTVSRPRSDSDIRLDTLIDGLWRVQDKPIPTAVVATQHTIGRLRRKYGLSVYTEPRAAMLWPPEADIVRLWLTKAIRSRREQ